MGGRCLGGEGSNEVEDVRVEKEWDGRCQGGEKEAMGWKMSGWRRKQQSGR